MELILPPPIGTDALRQLQEYSDITLPEELFKFYTEESDGVGLFWEKGDKGGMFALPPTQDLLAAARQFRSDAAESADDPASMDNCIDPEHRPEAFRIWNLMRTWLPIHDEPNGDNFCTRAEDGHVVFNQHDWFDGFGEIATTNGAVAGTSLVDFVSKWSRFYFTCPSSLWWGQCVKDGVFNWDESLFDPEFTRPLP